MRIHHVVLVAAGLGMVIGCGKDVQKTFEELKDDDVIVQVNDNVLRKRDMMRFWRMNVALLQQMKGQERKEAERRIKEDLMQFAPTFVDQRLMVDDARRCKVLTEAEVSDLVEQKIAATASAKKMTKEQFLNQFPDSEWFARETAETRIWINAHVASNIPPLVVVTPLMVSNYVNFVVNETAAVQATNDFKKATLVQLKADVEAGKAIFTNVATRISQDEWNLGAVELLDNSLDSQLRAKVFGATPGQMLDVTEDEEAYRILQVARVVPAEKNDKGRVVHPEQRVVYQIVLYKEDYPVPLTPAEAERDLKRQMQERAVEQHIEFLKTNGQNRVVWPNGRNLWRKRK